MRGATPSPGAALPAGAEGEAVGGGGPAGGGAGGAHPAQGSEVQGARDSWEERAGPGGGPAAAASAHHGDARGGEAVQRRAQGPGERKHKYQSRMARLSAGPTARTPPSLKQAPCVEFAELRGNKRAVGGGLARRRARKSAGFDQEGA